MDEVITLEPSELRQLKAALEAVIEELGVNTTFRQVIALVTISLANQAGKNIGVRDIDRELGDLLPGSSSKLLKSMMHVETERKGAISNTVRAERDLNDLRAWNLHVTPKGIKALAAVLDAANGR
jgi:DNA-binding MarR family transcriptional regulator